jgi:DNA polymerase III delta prime subunit
MGRPKPEEVKEMQYRKLVKEIWETEFYRSRDELAEILLENKFIKIKRGEKGTDIHTSFFEDYFNAAGHEELKTMRERIKIKLEQLL